MTQFAPNPRSGETRRASLLSLALDLQPAPAMFAPQMQHVPLLEASLTASLEQLPTSAFIFGPEGVTAANSRGRELLQRDYRMLARLQSPSEEATLFDRIPLEVPGFPGFHLVLFRGATDAAQSRATQFARRWRLTPRQSEVLALLVQGLSNKAISSALLCAERTVEQHVRHLFQKAGVNSRATLTARFWSGS